MQNKTWVNEGEATKKSVTFIIGVFLLLAFIFVSCGGPDDIQQVVVVKPTPTPTPTELPNQNIYEWEIINADTRTFRLVDEELNVVCYIYWAKNISCAQIDGQTK